MPLSRLYEPRRMKMGICTNPQGNRESGKVNSKDSGGGKNTYMYKREENKQQQGKTIDVYGLSVMRWT